MTIEHKSILVGVGMPASLYLDEFGVQVKNTFGSYPYLVGSAMYGKAWRDVDVRLILSDEEYAAWGFGCPNNPHTNGKWVGLVLAFSALGQQMTGLPCDFQIQQQSFANARYSGPRNTLGLVESQFAKPPNR